MDIRENFLRTVEFRKPEWIPCHINFSPLTQKTYGSALEHIKKKYKIIFERETSLGDLFKGNAPTYKKGYFRDNWGCLWYNKIEGLEGQVIEHPLADWRSLKTYKAPDPLSIRKNEWGDGLFDWSEIEDRIKEKKKKNELIWGLGERLFDRLYFLRGFENLMLDFATNNPNLEKLIEVLYEYEKKLIGKWLNIGVDIIWIHTDIATQNSTMISPQSFRRYLKPMYKDLFQTCRKAGVHVSLSTDGRVIELIDDFIECGASIHGPQAGAISLEEIKKYYKGRICIELDLDRQKFSFYKPKEMKNEIKKSIEALNSPEGGLMLFAGIFDNTVPLENVEALCQAFVKYCF